MEESAPRRRLAAIVCIDVAGYSRMMAGDEEGIFARLKAMRREVVDHAVRLCGGRIVKAMGDAVLVEFAGALEAVGCVLAIQAAMAARNAGAAREQRLDLRAGVHFGCVVVVDDEDLYGDNVNIAARLEALAEPGAVCISAPVLEQVRGWFPAEWADLGEHYLTNIARPVRVYRLVALRPGPWPVEPVGNGPAAADGRPPVPD